MEAGEHQDGSFPNAEPATNADEHSKLIQIDSLENGANSDPKVTSECKPDEILRNLQNVTYIYRQDVVKSKADGKAGIVTEVAGDSDSDSSLTDDEDDDEGDGEEDDDDDDGSNDDGDSSTEGDLDNNEKVGDDGGDDDGDSSTEGDLDNNEKVGDDGGDDDGDSNMEGHLDNNEKVGETADGNKDCSNYKSDPLTADHVRVFWMDESESTESIDDVTVIDRGFLHGDYVAAASDPTGQVGLVVDINISVDLLTHDGSIFKNISSRELKRVRDFTVGDYVVFGPWLGRIDDVFDNVTVMFDDGSVCKVMKVDPLRLKPVGRNGLEEAHFPYYPGQRVKASSSSVFKNSRWLSGVWKANKAEGTVTKVTVGSVLIYWIASAGYGPDSSTAPAEEQNPKNLKLLSCFSHSIWQLGDWCLLPSLPVWSSLDLDKQLSKLQLCDSTKTVSESTQSGADCDSEVVSLEESTGNSESVEIDVESSLDETLERNPPAESAASANSLSVSKESGQESWPLHRKKIRKVVVRRDKKARKKEENFERALLIVNTRTLVDVAWQDGKIERGLESTSLIPIESPGDHEFVAEQYVVEKAADDAEDSNDVRRVGVVKSVNAKERTATVRWLKLVTRAEDPREFDKEEVVSVYELEGHPDYDYCYGDLVVRLSPVSLPAKVGDVVKSAEEESEHHLVPAKAKEDDQNHLRCKKTEATPSDDTCSEISDLSWVGNITGLRDGDIEVTWADGMISTVGPQAIYVVDRDDDESIAAGSDGADDAASWETVEDNERETLENAKEELGTVNATDISIEDEAGAMGTENSGRNGALAFPLAALGFVTRLASGIFSRGHKQTSSLDSRSEDEEMEGASTRKDTGDGSCSQRCGDLDNSPRLPAAEKGEEHDAMEVTELDIIEANQKPGIGNSSDQHVSGTYNFKRFDITKDPYDHYFLGASGQSYAGRKWLKKVQQDWNILQNNLPDGIYVRVYEDQMDLLRAVVVGAYGTPYQDGLFFFDFHLPPEYPDVPPSAYYHSGGWRINPNLYEEGKVCLSLLNTWTGRGNEVWDPSSSSILQVLVSLQGLVLNSRPYFNEAGYDKQVGTAEGEKNSLSYNENTFLLNCKTMMYLMRKPPKDFEELIKEHFRMRGYYILKACDAYMKGFLIGSLRKDASISSNNDANSNSVGFKLMMAKIVPKLVLALSEIGVDCEEFKYLHQL